MFKKGSSFRKIFSRSKTKKKSKEDKSFRRTDIDNTSFQEIILTQSYTQQPYSEAQTKAIRDGSTLNEQPRTIRKRETSTKPRLNATEKKHENHNKRLGDVSAASSSNRETFTTFEGAQKVDGCLQDKKPKAERFAEDLRAQRADLNSVLFKSSSDKLSSASSSEGQPRKARDINGRARNDNVVPRRDRKTERSSVVEGTTVEDMASVYGWIRDTNKTVHDMQRCLVEIKSEMLSLSGIMKTRNDNGDKDSGEMQEVFETESANNVQNRQPNTSKQKQDKMQRKQQSKQQEKEQPQQAQQQQRPQSQQQQEQRQQQEQQQEQQQQQQEQQQQLQQQQQQQQQQNEQHQCDKQGQNCQQEKDLKQRQQQLATNLESTPIDRNETNSNKPTTKQKKESENSKMNEVGPDTTQHKPEISFKTTIAQDTDSSNARANDQENQTETKLDLPNLQSEVKDPNTDLISNLIDVENAEQSSSFESTMYEEEGTWVEDKNVTEQATEVDSAARKLCHDHQDGMPRRDHGESEQRCLNVCVCSLVNDLAQQLHCTIYRFFDHLDSLNGEVSQRQRSEKGCGCEENTRSNEYVGFQRNNKEHALDPKEQLEYRKERLSGCLQHCIKCCLKRSSFRDVSLKTTTSATSSCHQQTDTFDKERAIIAGSKCTCHLNGDERSIHDITLSSGYISEEASSGCSTRWEKGFFRSDPRWQKTCVRDCASTFRSYRGWGLSGNDFVQRHIVTSSPIIATLRDLKPQEI